ncbi:segregation and condensation protein A [Rathayibacter sp. VKM Ac-2630]|uniref:segregation and condensation protein A n=1 Tax=Rathayibacter sp. VKM Ac-2630 TaxID=1938617 RepID=UPI000980E0E7|nr:ScpA family protein [Rathayibacter sp. VKM Ac-2630]OOB89859.1 segregation/condensation protein A [Rathayibacter sp. VKM Ac-2630]
MARSPESVLDQEPVAEAAGGFRVALANFEGPFDLLLSLIAKQQVDITEIALSAVTDEFLSYLHGIDTLEGLDRASEFLVVAATLLDLKIAGLLPQGELVDAEDAALLEARDLLFARLLQYRAFKQVSSWFAERIEIETARHVRDVPLEEEYRARKPELVWTLSAEDFGALAAFALAPREIPTVGLDHLHAPLISIREQAAYVVGVLRERSTATFRELIATAEEKGVIVARFIAVLELYRHAAIAFEQPEPLGELTLQWVALSWSDANLAHLGADYDG